jgi:gluconate 2-dehydrogenase gamma chain
MVDEAIPRRQFLKGAAVAGTAVATAMTPVAEAQSAPPAHPAAPASSASADPEAWLMLTATEAAFFSAAADTIIPADALSPAGTECGVVIFIDRQLAGTWGGGAKTYRSGPFRKAKPEYGYQLPLTPREFFAASVVATNAWVNKTYGKDFDRLSLKERDDVLKLLDQSKAELADFNGKQFFEALLVRHPSRTRHCRKSTESAWRFHSFPYAGDTLCENGAPSAKSRRGGLSPDDRTPDWTTNGASPLSATGAQVALKNIGSSRFNRLRRGARTRPVIGFSSVAWATICARAAWRAALMSPVDRESALDSIPPESP